MELEGVVQNGVIVPQGECPLPEGTKVRIVPSAPDDHAAERTRSQQVQALVESIRAAKGVDPLPPDYDFLEALNANRGPGQRLLFTSDEKGKSW